MNEQVERARILWCCRRGMLELDLLLERFMAKGYDQMSAEQKQVFIRILSESDPDLYAWLMGYSIPEDAEFKSFVDWFRLHYSRSGKLK